MKNKSVDIKPCVSLSLPTYLEKSEKQQFSLTLFPASGFFPLGCSLNKLLPLSGLLKICRKKRKDRENMRKF